MTVTGHTISSFIANTKNYLQRDWLSGVQYWPYLYSIFNICTLEREKNNIRFVYHNIRITEKLPRHNVNNNQYLQKYKVGSKKMERFSATVSIEELKAKTKNGNTTKSTCQWLRVYLSWAKLRNKEQEIERLEPSRLDEILQ